MGKKGKKERESETPREEGGFQPLPVESKTPGTVVLLLNSTEEDILIKACESIHTFAEKGDENKVSLLGLGALEPLCRIITHNNKLVRRNAFMALGSMATNGDVKNVLKNLDVIPSFIQKLSLDEDAVVHEFSTLCLASLSVYYLCKVQICDNEGLPPLIQLLSSPDPDVTKNSLETIFNLVQEYQSRLAVHELGLIPPLLELLKSDFPVIQHLALKTLQSITTDKDTRTTFREHQGFDRIMDILHMVEYSDLHGEVLPIVANCLSDSESVHLIQKGGGLMRLMDFTLTPSSPEIQTNSINCITKVAHNSETRNLLHEQNVEKALVELLTVTDPHVRTSTCQAVAAMSFHLASKDRFRDLGGIPAVVQLLKSDNLIVKEAATQALANLTYNSQLNAFAVYEAGGHAILVRQLNVSCPKTVANSAATLCNMAGQEEIRCCILSQEAILALVEPLKSTDTQIQFNATQCLAVLACEDNARAELQRAGGVEALISLLHSFDKDVLHHACLAVDVCASDQATAVEMCKFGALEILQEINKSVNRRSRVTERAMRRLMNYNLSVKYSLTGHLTATDKITSGFYDAGKTRPGQRTLTLDELSKEPLNQQRPIIAINITEETIDASEEKQSNPGSTTSIKTDRETHKKKKKEDKPIDPIEEAPPESVPEKPWSMIEDVSLQTLITEAKESIILLDDEQEQFATLARLVSKTMGGEVKMGMSHEFSWMLHLSELKFDLQSNIVPIGMISKGFYCHRALLFKCLADCIGISCTLERGEYNRAWNEIQLLTWNPSNPGSSQSRRYIVDLMHEPGSLLALNSPAAVQYQCI